MIIAWLFLTANAEDRVELPVANKDDMTVVPVGEHGVVLFVQRKGEKKTYDIQHYDTDLTPTWTAQHPTKRLAYEAAWGHDDRHVWVLQTRGKKANLLRTRLEDGTTTDVEVKPKRRGLARDLSVDGLGGAWVGSFGGRHGTLTYVKPSGESVDVDIGKKHLVEGLTQAHDGLVQASIRSSVPKKGEAMRLLDLRQGKVIQERSIQPEGDLRLLSGRSVHVDDRELVVGTYAPKGLAARGMYIAGFDQTGQTFIRTHAFESFDGFFNWMGDRREARREKANARKLEKGKTEKLRLNLLVHDPITTERGLILVAESYFPVYTTYTYTTTVANPNGGVTTQTHTVTVFLGWRFTHALVAEFDHQGQRLWDQSLPLWSRLTPTLTQHVRVVHGTQDVTLVFAQKNKLRRATISGDRLQMDEAPLTVEQMGGDDTLKNLAGDAAWWHDDVFLAYGVDRIREADGGKEKVFFLSRLE